MEAICEALFTYHDDSENGHFGVALDSEYRERPRRTLATLARVDKFVGEVALKVLWKEPGFKPFIRLFPDDYIFSDSAYTMLTFKRQATIADYERFIHYSKSVWYLHLGEAPSVRVFKRFVEEYRGLFPTRPVFPQLKSLIWSVDEHAMPDSFLHSGLLSLQLNRPLFDDRVKHTANITVNGLQANSPNLIRLRDLVPMPNRGRFSDSYSPAGTPFQKRMDVLLYRWTHLHHLEVSRFLSQFPTLFVAVSQLQRLWYLKIAIALEVDKFTPPIIDGVEPALDVVHTASKMEIEGEIEHLHLALRLCSPGTRLTSISLLHYLNGGGDEDQTHDYFVLPPTLSQIQITELTIDLLDNGEDIPNHPPNWQLPCSAFSTLTTSKFNFTKVEMRINYCVATTDSFLDMMAKTSPGLTYFVILRTMRQDDEIFQFPILTLGGLIEFVLALPKLRHLGLEMDARSNTSLENRMDNPGTRLEQLDDRRVSSSSSVKIIEVGASPIDDVEYVANYLRVSLPALKYVGCEEGHHYYDSDQEKEKKDKTEVVWTGCFFSRWCKVRDLLSCLPFELEYLDAGRKW